MVRESVIDVNKLDIQKIKSLVDIPQKRGYIMSNWWYGFYFLILGVLSFFTGEVVTFVMLGFILLSLNNINNTLKKIYKSNKKDDDK